MVKKAALYIIGPGKFELAFRLSIISASLFGIAFSVSRAADGFHIGINPYLVAGAAALIGFVYLEAIKPAYKISRLLKCAMTLVAALSLMILLVV